MAESLKCSPKTIMTLLTGCSPIQNLFCVKKVSNMTDKKKKKSPLIFNMLEVL